MSKPDVWMPLYIADYLADTGRLTTEQHGAYLLLIMDYWRNGALPDDDSVLSTITKLSPKQWAKHRTSIARMFSVHDGAWHHKRIDAELLEAKENAERKKAKAKKAADARWAKDDEDATSIPPSIPPSSATEMLEQCPSPSPSPKNISPERVEITPHSSVNAQERPSVSISSVTPTQAGEMAKALRPHNIPVTPSHPELLAWIAEGASVDLVLEAVELARMQKPAPQKIAPAYLTAIVRSLLAGPKSNGARAGPRAPTKHEARMEFWKQMNGGGEDGRDSQPERVIEGEAERVG